MENTKQSLNKSSAGAVQSAAHQLKPAAGFFLPDNRNATTVQMKTSVNYQGQSYTYGKGETQMVGKQMEAHLDPAQPIRGQSANVNSSQNTMMTAIRSAWGINGGNLVKGHLLNDNLGGNALSSNLFPITKPANSAHLGYVENLAKQQLWEENQGVFYKVTAYGKPSIDTAVSAFRCQIKEWDPSTKKYGKQLLNTDIYSDLNDVKSKDAYHDVYDKINDDPERYGNPLKPKGFHEPAKSVGALSPVEDTYRDKDNVGTLPSNMTWSRG